MKADSVSLLSFLERAPQLIVPLYQRRYSWEEEQCRQLWDDIVTAGRKNAYEHFFGTIVYVADEASNSPLLVIDGQQRLTTVSLFLLALAKRLGKSDNPESLFRKNIYDSYLLNSSENGEKHCRLLLTDEDKETFANLINNLPAPEPESPRITENFVWFWDNLEEAGSEILENICNGIKKLAVVEVGLSRKEGNPQLVFESMNSKGLALTQADLIRNYILIGLEMGLQERLYANYWRPMEENFRKKFSKFDNFIRHYLILKMESIPKTAEIYKAFKAYHKLQARDNDLTMEYIVRDMYKFSGYYCAMIFEREQTVTLRYEFKDIADLKVDVVYPFLLQLYDDWKEGIISEEELLKCLRLTESYVFRRAVCNIPTHSLSKTFASLGHEINKRRYFKSLCRIFQDMGSYRRFPNNREFKSAFMAGDLFNIRLCPYWLYKYENYGRDEPIKKQVVEHIMPREMTDSWKNALGGEWKRIHNKWLNTAGNLTLVDFSNLLGNRSFTENRDNVFINSPLRLNEDLYQFSEWGESEIKERAKHMAEFATQIWIDIDR